MTTTNEKAAGCSTTATAQNQTLPRKFSAKSTASEAQRERIIAALRIGPKTSYDLRRLGCYQAPARIKELRDRFGFNIITDRVTLYDRDGYAHPRAALYTLISEPMGGAS